MVETNNLSDADENRNFVNNLLFETPGGVRFTQDSPVLPTVWYAYAKNPRQQQELILTVEKKSGTGVAAKQIREMLKTLRKKFNNNELGDSYPAPRGDFIREKPRVSYIPGQIAVRLYFDELVRVALPLTPWWAEMAGLCKEAENASGLEYASIFPHPDEHRENMLRDALLILRREIDDEANAVQQDVVVSEAIGADRIPVEFSWLVRIVSCLYDSFLSGVPLLGEDTLSSALLSDFRIVEQSNIGRIETEREQIDRLSALAGDLDAAIASRQRMSKTFLHLFTNWSPRKKDLPETARVWRITKNRAVNLAVTKSALTVKADAARRLFDVSCNKITWAIVDSGIDRDHPAFKNTSEEHERERLKQLKKSKSDEQAESTELRVEQLGSRVVKTLDFTNLRSLLDCDVDSSPKTPEEEQREQKIIEKIARRLGPKKSSKATGIYRSLQKRIRDGKDVSWQDLEEAVTDFNPSKPINDHGTHVAGVLAADWIDEDYDRSAALAVRPRIMKGICPDINLIDVRVFSKSGLTDEFELLAAMQFLRWMNERAGLMSVHGANMSLSLIHEVRHFACGQTPICNECDEAVAAGMVVVAAAGNRGFDIEDERRITFADGYRSVSITDPGNAESVITVGATHRKRPHEYGVSYFSSRGPTGDGRLKPDLIAPGEKIQGPTPDGRKEFKDGTSMAAPHVSGAAALLMARNNELIANPRKIKSILCTTATDLGREPYFQGHGLLDVLRAMQSL